MLWLLLSCAEPVPPVQAAPAPAPVVSVPEAKPSEPVFTAEISPIPADLRAEMTGVSWREGCPVSLDDLVVLTVSHHDFAGGVSTGRLVVAADVAETVKSAFGAAFAAGYPIERMVPVSAYGGDDDRSMAANNTSAFNCRNVAGTRAWSEHSAGSAIDINPLYNPYVSRGGTVSPAAGAPYADRARTDVVAYLTADSPLVASFLAAGWGWGGQWSSAKDYQHVSRSGR